MDCNMATLTTDPYAQHTELEIAVSGKPLNDYQVYFCEPGVTVADAIENNKLILHVTISKHYSPFARYYTTDSKMLTILHRDDPTYDKYVNWAKKILEKEA